jgi:hypothetical protein
MCFRVVPSPWLALALSKRPLPPLSTVCQRSPIEHSASSFEFRLGRTDHAHCAAGQIFSTYSNRIIAKLWNAPQKFSVSVFLSQKPGTTSGTTRVLVLVATTEVPIQYYSLRFGKGPLLDRPPTEGYGTGTRRRCSGSKPKPKPATSAREVRCVARRSPRPPLEFPLTHKKYPTVVTADPPESVFPRYLFKSSPFVFFSFGYVLDIHLSSHCAHSTPSVPGYPTLHQ